MIQGRFTVTTVITVNQTSIQSAAFQTAYQINMTEMIKKCIINRDFKQQLFKISDNKQ